MQFRFLTRGSTDHIRQLPSVNHRARAMLRVGQRRRVGLLHGKEIKRRAHEGYLATGSADHKLAKARGG